MLRTIGVIVLLTGLAVLVGAAAITGPSAGDADLGAGGLLLVGRAVCATGLLLVFVDAVHRLSDDDDVILEHPGGWSYPFSHLRARSTD